MSLDDYAHWTDNLAGRKPPIHDGDPQCGYYRRKVGGRNGAYVAAAIWRDEDGQIVCRVGDQMCDAVSEWTRLAGHPVSEEDAQCYFETGQWPHAAPREAVPGDNIGSDDPFEQLGREVEVEIDAARDWLARQKGRLATSTAADVAGDKVEALRKLSRRADGARTTEKEPHLRAGQAVDAKYRPLLKSIEDAMGEIKRLLIAWHDAQREAERRAAEEAAAKAAAAAEGGEIPFDPPAPEPAGKLQVGGHEGKKVGFATRTVLVVADPAKAFRAVKDDPDVIEAIRAACDRHWKRTGKLPAGCKTDEVTSVR